MPTANIEVPAFLIHNNIPIYQMYQDDWYENGPYTYFYSMVPYPDKAEESFDIRDLTSFDAKLSIEDNLRKAINEKTLPIFQLPTEELKKYFYDREFGNISTTPEQDNCYLFVDELYTKIANSSPGDAFYTHLLDDFTNQEYTLFLLPEGNENSNTGYHLYLYDSKASWNDFYNTLATQDLCVSSSELTQAIFIVMEVPYPLKPKNYLIPDDEIMVAQDEKEETIDVYLWATDYLVNCVKFEESGKYNLKSSEDIHDINFYGLFNVTENIVKVDGTYYHDVNGKEVQEEFTLSLYEHEKEALKEIINDYCQKLHGKSVIELVNEAKTEDKLPLIEPSGMVVNPIHTVIDMEKLQAYLKQDMIMEFDSVEECMDYFNTYDGQNFASTEELKAYQQEYGFGIGEKWYHVSFDAALDVYQTNINPSLKTMIAGASDRMNDNHITAKHHIEPERS